MSKKIVYILQIFLLTTIYYGTGKFGLSIDPVGGFAALIWLPAGISLAALIVLGSRVSPGIFVGAFLVNFTAGAPLLSALGIATGNTLEALVAFYLLRRIDFHSSFERVRDVIGFLVYAVYGSTFISATFGTVSLLFGQVISLSSVVSVWIAWWVGDMLSNLIVVPSIMLFLRAVSLKLDKKRIYELLLLWVFIAIIGVIIFTDQLGSITWNSSPITYLVFPPVIWMALRFSQRGVVTSTLVLTVFAIWGTLQGFGPFVRTSISESLLLLQSFIAVLVTTAMILSSAISERRMLEQQKDNFLSVASHELKTPLTIIKAYIQLLEKRNIKKKDLKSREYITTIHVYVEKMNQLICDLLDLRKIESGSLTLDRQRIDINKLIDQSIKDIQSTTTKHVLIKKGNVNMYIVGDKNRLSQVINNLLTNAIKYSPRTKKIVVNIKKEKENVLISVRDFGIGIQKDYHSRIFERFFRIVEYNKTTISGFGLGLYIANQIVKQHDGKIWVDSKKGVGSIFYVMLPIAN